MCRCTIQEIQSPLGSLHRLRVANSIPSIFHRRRTPQAAAAAQTRRASRGPALSRNGRRHLLAGPADSECAPGLFHRRRRRSGPCTRRRHGAPRSHVTRPPAVSSHPTCSRTGRRAVRLAAGPSRRQPGRPPAASRGSARRHCDREITLTADRLCLCLCLRH